MYLTGRKLVKEVKCEKCFWSGGCQSMDNNCDFYYCIEDEFDEAKAREEYISDYQEYLVESGYYD